MIPVLTSERLLLRPFQMSDLENFYTILSDPDVSKFVLGKPIEDIQAAEQLLKSQYIDTYTSKKSCNYAICLKEDSTVIGYINIHQDDSFDLGYGLRKEFWHQGITKEAVRCIMARAKELGYPYLTATHDVLNPNSGRVMQASGMQYQYSYEEVWRNGCTVTFRMYQINFRTDPSFVYRTYWDLYPHTIEEIER